VYGLTTPAGVYQKATLEIQRHASGTTLMRRLPNVDWQMIEFSNMLGAYSIGIDNIAIANPSPINGTGVENCVFGRVVSAR
jgi:hypothetical protein